MEGTGLQAGLAQDEAWIVVNVRQDQQDYVRCEVRSLADDSSRESDLGSWCAKQRTEAAAKDGPAPAFPCLSLTLFVCDLWLQ